MFMKILNKERKPKQISILIIGLNNSGKSTIVNYFKNKDDRKSVSVPTIGFNIEHFESQWKLFFLLLSFENYFLWLWPSPTFKNQLGRSDRWFVCNVTPARFLPVCIDLFSPPNRSRCFVHGLWHGWHRKVSKFVGTSFQNM